MNYRTLRIIFIDSLKHSDVERLGVCINVEINYTSSGLSDFTNFRTITYLCGMKKLSALALLIVCLSACGSSSGYKGIAVEYLKKKVANPATIDTVKFFKPDSIYTSFYDTNEYGSLKFSIDSLVRLNDAKGAAKLSVVLKDRLKTYPKTIVGWGVRLIYKAKDKKGTVKTDTCRFTFDPNRTTVKYVNGVEL